MFGVVWKFEIWVYVAEGIQVMSLCAIQLLEDDDDGLLMSGFSIYSYIGMKFGQESMCKNKYRQNFWDSSILGSWRFEVVWPGHSW